MSDLFSFIHLPPSSLTDEQLRACYLHDWEWICTHRCSNPEGMAMYERATAFGDEMKRRGLLVEKGKEE